MGGRPESRRWQSEITNLAQGFKKLHETGELTDMTFLLRGNAEMKRFNVHKLVLAARSTEFQRILLDPNAPNPIIIDSETGITETGFRILLRFIYTDTLDNEEEVPIVEAFIAAEHYRQVALQELCKIKISSWVITTNNVWKLFNAGLNVPIVKDKCQAFIKKNAIGAISHPSFTDISLPCLTAILDSEVLKSAQTFLRLNKIMAWAANQYKDFERVRKVFLENNLLYKLEIEELSLEELRSVRKNYKGLLTPEEVVSFMEYTEDRDVSILPSWCAKKNN